ncbi:MAG: hypothetical protein Q8K70_06740 [Bacteroidota bacterium]|nr:hypothetical protein [Bacteroidota bacterium]
MDNKNSKMKQILLTATLLIISKLSFSQEIDSSNYCNYYDMNAHYQGAKVKITTTYLSKLEIAEIVFDEMQKLGYDHLFNFRIVQIDSMTHVNSICYSEKSKIGFLYEGSCGMVPKQENRHVVSLYKEMAGYAYAEKIVTTDGESDFIKVKDLPNNLYILKMENYWFQESDDLETNKKLVSKEFIVNLLREDVRRIAPKLEAIHSNK